jgi:hypothetical protein
MPNESKGESMKPDKDVKNQRNAETSLVVRPEQDDNQLELSHPNELTQEDRKHLNNAVAIQEQKERMSEDFIVNYIRDLILKARDEEESDEDKKNRRGASRFENAKPFRSKRFTNEQLTALSEHYGAQKIIQIAVESIMRESFSAQDKSNEQCLIEKLSIAAPEAKAAVAQIKQERVQNLKAAAPQLMKAKDMTEFESLLATHADNHAQQAHNIFEATCRAALSPEDIKANVALPAEKMDIIKTQVQNEKSCFMKGARLECLGLHAKESLSSVQDYVMSHLKNMSAEEVAGHFETSVAGMFGLPDDVMGGLQEGLDTDIDLGAIFGGLGR